MSDTDENGKKLRITDEQRQGLKIANLAVKNWACYLSLEATLRIHRTDADDPGHFDEVIHTVATLGSTRIDPADGAVSLDHVQVAAMRLYNEAQETGLQDEEAIHSFVRAALIGKAKS